MKTTLFLGWLLLCIIDAIAQDTLRTPLSEIGYGELEDVKLTNDEKHLITLSGKVFIWDVATEKVVATINPEGFDNFRVIEVLPDDSTLVTGRTGNVSFWKIPSGTFIRSISVPKDLEYIKEIIATPDGARLVLTTDRKSFMCLMDGTLVPEFKPDLAIHDGIFSRDGRKIAIHGFGIVDGMTGRTLADLRFPNPFKQGSYLYVRVDDYSKDGTRLIANVSGTPAVFKIDSFQTTRLDLHNDVGAWNFKFLPGDTLAVGTRSQDGRLVFFNTFTGDTTRSMMASGPAYIRKVSSSGRYLLTGSQELSLLDIRNGDLDKAFLGHSYFFGNWHVSPDNKRVITANGVDPIARIWDVASGSLVGAIEIDSSNIWDAKYTPDGKSIVTIAAWDSVSFLKEKLLPTRVKFGFSAPRGVALWDARTLEASGILADKSWGGEIVSVSPDGGKVAAGGHNSLLVWDVPTGERLLSISSATQFGSLRFSPNSSQIAASSYLGNQFWAWDIGTGKSLFVGSTISTSPVLAYSPDGTMLAVGFEYNPGAVYSALTGELQYPLTGSGFPDWSRDGMRIALSDFGGASQFDVPQKKADIWYRPGYYSLGVTHGSAPAYSVDGSRLYTNLCGRIQAWDNTRFNTVRAAVPRQRRGRAILQSRGGHSLRLVTDEAMRGPVLVELISPSGIKVFRAYEEATRKSGLSLEIPSRVPEGLYFYRIRAQGQVIGAGQVRISA